MRRSKVGGYAERVCVVIAGGGADEDIRRCLGDSLPICIVRWQAGSYFDAVTRLQPQVIVVVSEGDQLARDSAKLVAQLVSSPGPTVVSLNYGNGSHEPSQLLVHQVGPGAAVRIRSLADLYLPR